jgi:hypothetical protein
VNDHLRDPTTHPAQHVKKRGNLKNEALAITSIAEGRLAQSFGSQLVRARFAIGGAFRLEWPTWQLKSSTVLDGSSNTSLETSSLISQMKEFILLCLFGSNCCDLHLDRYVEL